MQDKTYVITEIVGVSDNSVSQAVANAIARANQTLKALDWFEVKEGKATILKPNGKNYAVVARVQMDEWPRIAATARK